MNQPYEIWSEEEKIYVLVGHLEFESERNCWTNTLRKYGKYFKPCRTNKTLKLKYQEVKNCSILFNEAKKIFQIFNEYIFCASGMCEDERNCIKKIVELRGKYI